MTYISVSLDHVLPWNEVKHIFRAKFCSMLLLSDLIKAIRVSCLQYLNYLSRIHIRNICELLSVTSYSVIFDAKL